MNYYSDCTPVGVTPAGVAVSEPPSPPRAPKGPRWRTAVRHALTTLSVMGVLMCANSLAANAASLSINSPTVGEGDGTNTTANFIVTVIGGNPNGITVNYSTQGSSAIAEEDYTEKTGTLTIPATQTSGTISIPVIGDILDDDGETFDVYLDTAQDNLGNEVTLNSDHGTCLINDNDSSTDGVLINDATVTEGNTGSTNATFTISLTKKSARPVELYVQTQDNTATDGEDYTGYLDYVTIPANTLSTTLNIPVTGDQKTESDEYFYVNISDSNYAATIQDGEGIGTITNDDITPKISVGNVSTPEGDVLAKTVNVTLSLSSSPAFDVTGFYYTTYTGSAYPNEDYQDINQTPFTIPAGQTSITVPVTAIGDIYNETAETFDVVVTSVENADIADDTGTVTLTNDDSGAGLSIANLSTPEGDAASKTVNVTASLSKASPVDVTGYYYFTAGNATSGSDYEDASGTAFTIPAGQTSVGLPVTIYGDIISEPTETFTVYVASVTGSDVVDDRGIVSITNDDAGAGLSVGDLSVAEGDGTHIINVPLTLSKASPIDVTGQYYFNNVTPGTATAGTDFEDTSGNTFTIPAGQTTGSIPLNVYGDLFVEANETITVTVQNVTGSGVLDNKGIVTLTNDDVAGAGLTVGDATAVEGDAATKAVSVPITLSKALSVDVTGNIYFNYDTPGTADNSDFENISGTSFTIPAGQTSITVPFNLYGDILNEANETITITAESVSGAPVADKKGIFTITNDDTGAGLSISDATIVEGDAVSKDGTVTISISKVAPYDVTGTYVNYYTAGTADTSDYLQSSGSFTIPAGQTSTTAPFTIYGDILNEANDTFIQEVINASGADVLDGKGTVTITNDDTGAGLSVSDATIVEGDAVSKDGTVTISISKAAPYDVSGTYVNYYTNGTADTSDYLQSSGSYTITAGQTSTTVPFTIYGDINDEGNETFIQEVTGATGADVLDAQGTVTITNDDAGAGVSVSDVRITEGLPSADFTFTLSKKAPQDLSVYYSLSAVTATGNVDYQDTNSYVTIPAGQTSTTVSIPVYDDFDVEGTETFNLNIDTNSTTGVKAVDGTGVGTIVDDETIPGLSVSNQTVTEGNSGTSTMTFNVTLSSIAPYPITVKYATSGGTATGGTDYVTKTGTLNIPQYATSATIPVTINGDTLYEANETFNLTLNTPTNATLTKATGVGTITDDDTAPTIAIGDATTTEGNSGTKNLSFTITQSFITGRATTVTYTTADGTAKQPGDYTSSTGTATIAAGQTTGTVNIPIVGDTTFESDENFVVNLSAPSGATITDGQATGTITNDDTQANANLTVNDVSVVEGNSGTKTLTFTVTQSQATAATTTVTYTTADGTATAGSDYVAKTGNVTIAPGATTATFNVTINGDTMAEANETVLVNLSNSVNAAITDPQGVGTITNDDTNPTLSINDATVTENTSGTKTVDFTVTLSAVSGLPISVVYATAPGTATAGTDYVTKAGTLNIPAGSATGTITITINGDVATEGNETFFVNLTNPTNATIADNQGLGTIQDSDTIKPTVTITKPLPDQKMLISAFKSGGIAGTAADNKQVVSVEVKITRLRGGVVYTWNGTTFSTASVRVPATVTGSGTNVSWVLNTPFPSAAQLDAGEYIIVVYATDASANVGNATVRTTLYPADSEPPVAQVFTPTLNQKILLSTFTSGAANIISGNATDNIGITSVRVKFGRKRGTTNYYWNGTAFTTSPFLLTANVVPVGSASPKWNLDGQMPSLSQLDSGLYQIEVYATDVANNKSPVVVRPFTLGTDFTAPSVAIVAPTANQKLAISSFGSGTINGTAGDNLGITSVKVKLIRKRGTTTTYWNGTAFVTTTSTVDATVTPAGGTNVTWSLTNAPTPATGLDAGAYTIYASAYDAAGNTKSSASRGFTLTPAAGDPAVSDAPIPSGFSGGRS